MNDIDSATPASQLTSQYSTDRLVVKRSRELGQQDFLELMTAQIQNQDPFQPMENGDFIAQMAQFSSVESLDEMKNTMSELASSLVSDQTLRAASLIGREVMVPGREAVLANSEDSTVRGGVIADAPFQRIAVNIFNATNELVRQIPIESPRFGTNHFTWDGTGPGGEHLPAGRYRVEAEAFDGESTALLPTAFSTRVEGVIPGDGRGSAVMKLEDSRTAELADVLEIL